MLRLTMPRPQPLGGRLPELQILRAVAVLMVVVWHSTGLWAPFFEMNPLPLRIGYAGVDLFFCISGFIMMHVTARGGFSLSDFARKRVVRIVPMYWIVTTAVLAAWLLRPDVVPMRADEPVPYIVASYLLLPTEQRPLLGVAWSLQHEFIFYALVAVCMASGMRRLILPVLLVLFAIGVIIHVVLKPYFGFQWDYRIFSLYHFEFAAGVAAYHFLCRRTLVNPLPLTVVGCVLFWLNGWLLAWLLSDIPEGGYGALDHVIQTGLDGLVRCVGYGFSAFLILVGTLSLSLDRPIARPAILLGDASYAIYLFHNLFLQAAGKVTERFVRDLPTFIAVDFVVIIAICVSGILLFRYLEKPLIRLVERALEGRRRDKPPAAASW